MAKGGYALVPHAASLDAPQAATVAMWVKFRSAPAMFPQEQRGWVGLLSKGGWWQENYALGLARRLLLRVRTGFRFDLLACSDRFSNADVTQPMQFGSHRSPLVRVLLDDSLHRDKVKLSPADWDALVTWVDANAPYHDAFLNKRPVAGGPPRREIRPRFPPLAAMDRP